MSKGLISWPNNKYMNIWVVNSIRLGSATQGTVLGYAYKPIRVKAPPMTALSFVTTAWA
jgi:hypothetical protein